MATSDLELSKHIAIARAVRDDMSASDFTALASDLFPPAPSTTTAASSAIDAADARDDKEEAELEAALKKLLTRQQHSKPHAWTAPAPEPTAPAPATDEPEEPQSLRIPKEHDRTSLLQTISIKDALVRQMEAALLLPQPENSATVPLTRRAQALVANARRREAVLACKLKALTLEVEHFRKREVEAVRINHGLRRRLRDALTDLDAIALRREVRTLRADLSAALAREAALQRSVLLANQRIEADYIKIGEHGVKERKLRDDMEYLRRVAYNAMAARASAAMGVGTLYD